MRRRSDGWGMALISLAVLSLFGCTRQLQDLNAALSKINNSLPIANSNRTPSSPSSPNIPRMSVAQAETLHTLLMKQSHEHAIAQARAEADSDIEKILGLSACYSDWYPHTILRQYALPEKREFIMPMWGMRYHPRSACLTVNRLDSWKMLAKNAITFRAVFVSEESSESAQVIYEMRRQQDGVWLLR